MSNLYLADGFILPFFNLVCLIVHRGRTPGFLVLSFFPFLLTRCRGVLLVLVN